MSDGLDYWYHRSVNAFASAGQDAFRWYYISILPGNELIIRPPDWFDERPSDANPDNGNPATPYFRFEEHHDENHIHIRAVDEYHALRRAHAIIKERQHGSIIDRLKVTLTK